MNSHHRPDNPFPGLRSFTQEEDHLFFGREAQTMELLQTLGAQRFVAVVGSSGSGKSSLVRCGLLSHLLGGKMLQAGTVWEVAVTHPGAAPMSHLADSMLESELYDETEEDAKARLLATLNRSHSGLVEAIRQARLGENVNFLLVVDQFEEIFRFNQGGGAQREAASEFVSMLLHSAAQKEVPIYIVLTMRSDFIGDCAQFEELAEAVNRGEYLIPRMNREQFKQSIEGPIRVAGGSVTPRLLQRVLNDLGDQADQLPCLQHALMRTWDHWKRRSKDIGISEINEPEADSLASNIPSTKAADIPQSQIANRKSEIAPRSLDLDDYNAIGRMQTALSRHADEIYESLGSDRARQLCAAMFKAITVRESENRGIRRPLRMDRLAEIVDVPAAEFTPIIEAYRQLGVTFLMPPPSVPLEDSTVIDISHESLMRVWVRLREWVEEEAQSVGIFHRLAESAQLEEVGKAGLYRDPELGIALAWRDEANPNAAWADQYGGGFDRAMAYLERSRVEAEREEQEREAARQRELEQAKAIAENQRLRAEEKSRSARRMRWLMRLAMAVAVVAVIASFYAVRASRYADKQRAAALDAEAKVGRELYVADMNRAGQAYAEGSFNELNELLNRHIQKEGKAEASDLRGPEWYFWHQASRRERATMVSPGGHFNELIVAPDQKTVATVCWPGNVALFDVASRNLVRQLPVNGSDYKGAMPAVAYSPDGRTLVVSGPDPSNLRRWDTRTWQPLSPDLTFPEGATNQIGAGRSFINRLAYSPDGFLLAAGAGDGRVALWDSRTWQVVKVLEVSNENPGANNVWELAFSPDGSQLAAAVGMQDGPFTSSDTGALEIWNVARLEPVFRRPSKSPLTTLAYSPDGHRLITGEKSGAVNLWEMNPLPSSAPEQLYKARAIVLRVRFSPSGRYFAASTAEGNAILVGELEPSPRMVSRLKGHSKPSRMEFVGDDFTVWSADQEHFLKVWDVRESGVAPEIAGSERGAGTCYLAGGHLAWRSPPAEDSFARAQLKDFLGRERAGIPSPIRLYDVATGREMPPWQEGARFAIHAASPDGRFLAAQREDGRIQHWDAGNGELLGTSDRPASKGDHVTTLLTVSDDGNQVAWVEIDSGEDWNLRGFKSHGLQLWSPTTGRRVRLAGTDFAGNTYAVALSHDGSLLAISGHTGTQFQVMLWDIAPEQPILLETVPVAPVFSMAFSPDGTRLACGQWNSEIHLIDPRTGKQLVLPLLGHADSVVSVAFSPDGKTLFSGSYDRTLRLWDASTGVRRATLPSLENTIATRFIIEPEGRWMVSKLLDQAARLWRLDDAIDLKRDEMFWWEEGASAGRRGDFARAREVARQAVQQAPDQAIGGPWIALAALSVHEGDLEGFRKVRRDMLARYGDKPYRIPAVFTALACTMLPAAPSELETGRKLAEMVAADGDFNSRIDNWNGACLTLAEFRQGNYAVAAEKAEKYLAIEFGVPTPENDIAVVLAQAMSQHQLQNQDAALAALTKARELMADLDEQYPGSADHPSQPLWWEWLLDKALMAEAEALIEGKP